MYQMSFISSLPTASCYPDSCQREEHDKYSGSDWPWLSEQNASPPWGSAVWVTQKSEHNSNFSFNGVIPGVSLLCSRAPCHLLQDRVKILTCETENPEHQELCRGPCSCSQHLSERWRSFMCVFKVSLSWRHYCLENTHINNQGFYKWFVYVSLYLYVWAVVHFVMLWEKPILNCW